jgi:hypothetical protein
MMVDGAFPAHLDLYLVQDCFDSYGDPRVIDGFGGQQLGPRILSSVPDNGRGLWPSHPSRPLRPLRPGSTRSIVLMRSDSP